MKILIFIIIYLLIGLIVSGIAYGLDATEDIDGYDDSFDFFTDNLGAIIIVMIFHPIFVIGYIASAGTMKIAKEIRKYIEDRDDTGRT